MSSEPMLSVIIASVNGLSYLKPCLESIAAQEGETAIEVLVVDRTGPEAARYMSDFHPGVILIPVAAETSLPAMRSNGIRKARGSIIALTEDHCIVPSDWTKRINAAHANNPTPVIGGALENGAAERLMDRAIFLSEYLPFSHPMPIGEVSALAAANVSYKRPALLAFMEDDFSEWDIHVKVQRDGFYLWSEPGLTVVHQKQFGFGEYLKERYHYSRWFAARRAVRQRTIEKWGVLVLIWVLPLLSFYRMVRDLASRPRYLRDFIPAFPLFVVFWIVSAVGEAFGILFGPGISGLYLK